MSVILHEFMCQVTQEPSPVLINHVFRGGVTGKERKGQELYLSVKSSSTGALIIIIIGDTVN